MMRDTITKRQIIQALRTEPLTAGHWIANTPSSKVCPVCAVGAVLRAAGADNDQIATKANELTDPGDICYDYLTPPLAHAQNELDAGRYLNALSVYYEGLTVQAGINGIGLGLLKGYKIGAIRRKLITWVKKNFPATVSLKPPKGKGLGQAS